MWRSRKVEKSSQKIQDEAHVRPHKMANLKNKSGSMRSPDRKISPESTHYEANLMQIRPKNMATLKDTPKNVSKNDTSVNHCSMYKEGQKRITKSSQIDTYLHKVRTQVIYTGENIVKKKTTIKLENST